MAARLAFRPEDPESVRAACDAFRETWSRLRQAIGCRLVGQATVVDLVLVALIGDGHVLLEGVPGLGKTLLVRTLSETLGLDFARIQLTPDVMPADITGTNLVTEDERTGHRTFVFRPGPIFHQLILADEINRATPKTQAALLEAMQERTVTTGGETRPLERPFLVMATQNPIEQEGTYPLPEAQLDRFFFKVVVPAAERGELNEIVDRTTKGLMPDVPLVLDSEAIIAAQRLARAVVVSPAVQDYVVRLVLATHPGGEHAPPDLGRVVRVGASPRAAQTLLAAARVVALVDGRYAASFDDVDRVAAPALRHRLIRTFEAENGGVGDDVIVHRLVAHVPHDPDGSPAGDADPLDAVVAGARRLLDPRRWRANGRP